MAAQYQKKSKQELIEIILSLERNQTELEKENQRYIKQIDDFESQEDGQAKRIKLEESGENKIKSLQNEIAENKIKLEESRKTQAKYLSEKVALQKDIEKLKNNVSELENSLEKSHHNNSVLRNDLAYIKEKELTVVRNTVQIKLEEYFLLNKPITEKKFGQPKDLDI